MSLTTVIVLVALLLAAFFVGCILVGRRRLRPDTEPTPTRERVVLTPPRGTRTSPRRSAGRTYGDTRGGGDF